MTKTTTAAIARADTDILAIVAALALGTALIFAAGFSSAAVMHDVGHDQRHSIAFPCH